jgi:hypothetical protein
MLLTTFLLWLATNPGFVALVLAHKVTAGLIVWVAFSAVVDGMPAPPPNASLGYRWLYASLNLLAVNAYRVLSVLSPRFAALLARKSPDSKEQPQ